MKAALPYLTTQVTTTHTNLNIRFSLCLWKAYGTPEFLEHLCLPPGLRPFSLTAQLFNFLKQKLCGMLQMAKHLQCSLKSCYKKSPQTKSYCIEEFIFKCKSNSPTIFLFWKMRFTLSCVARDYQGRREIFPHFKQQLSK